VHEKSCENLPQFTVAVLGGHLDDAGLVDDAGGAVALLYDADDPRLVSLLFFYVLTTLQPAPAAKR